MQVGLFVAAVISTSLTVASPAHADDSSDFLARVSGEGIDVGDTPTDVQFTLSTGMEVCHVLYYGYTQQQAGLMVPYRFPNASARQVAGFVEAAQATLCLRGFNVPLQPGGSY